MTILSPAALAQLDKPRDIPYAKFKLLIWTVFLVSVTLSFLTGSLKLFQIPGNRGLAWLILILALALVWAIIKRVLPAWLHLGQPAVSISKEGLTFAGQALIPWSRIENNTWESLSSGMMTAGASITLQTTERKMKIWSLYFKCDGDEYVHYCELYRAASEQQG